MRAVEIAGPVLYLIALGLFLSFFIPYILFWVGVGVNVIFMFVPVIIALALYFFGNVVIPDVPYKTYVALGVTVLPLLLFPNLRIHSTFWERIAPTAGKLLMAGVLVFLVFAVHRCYRAMGATGATVVSSLSFLLGCAVSSLVPLGELGWILEPPLLLALFMASAITLILGEFG